MSIAQYPDIFDELKTQVKEAGLLARVPIRGSIEMAGAIFSMIIVYAIVINWESLSTPSWAPFALGFFMTIIFTRAVFISHDILHLQYFKNKSLSFKLSYPFAAIMISNSSSWWDFKHNINHHTWCNVPQKDEDILAMDGAFTPNNKGDQGWLRSSKYLVFWGSMFFMYSAFIIQSYNFAIKRKKFGELFLMLLHWPIVWGPVFYFLPFADALTVWLVLNFTLSPWLAFGFITNHLGCEVFEKDESEDLTWMELQMRTSRSLKGGKFIHWFYGGLNTQIEHHLFPKAPRFNLLKIQEMTREFAHKNNIKYFETTPIEAYVQINDVLKEY
ncbi:MAG: acyl-CoA desaturase [Campylobacterota bacterium]|nr:acyl-CoA desaturase [Campylobacterota bacterium]